MSPIFYIENPLNLVALLTQILIIVFPLNSINSIVDKHIVITLMYQ